jgi:hypothetical protein
VPSADDKLPIGMKRPSGEATLDYGIWKSRCCGDEIVLYSGIRLPVCTRHPETETEWVLISNSWFSKPKDASRTTKPARPAETHTPHLSPDRLKSLSVEGVVSDKAECAHLTRCDICRSQLERLALAYHRKRSTRGRSTSNLTTGAEPRVRDASEGASEGSNSEQAPIDLLERLGRAKNP